MDIGVADESLNGIPYEESSESEDDVETEETEGEINEKILQLKKDTSLKFYIINLLNLARMWISPLI